MSNRISEENLERLRKMKAENLKKLRKMKALQAFLFCRRAPAKNTRSHRIKIIFRSIQEIPPHLKTEWRKYLKRKIYCGLN